MTPWLVLVVMATSTVAEAEPSPLWSVPERGTAVARLSLEAELSVHRTLMPVSVAPDLVLGLRDRVALTLHYSRASQAQIGAGNGICFVGVRETLGADESRCVESETGLGIGALARLTAHTAARTGIVSRAPGALSAGLGTASKWQRGRFWILAAPTILVALTGRDHGNRERLQAATYAGLTLGRIEVHTRTGIEAALATFEETFAIPLGLGTSVRVGNLRFGIDGSLDRALGALNTVRWRSASVFVETRFGGAS